LSSIILHERAISQLEVFSPARNLPKENSGASGGFISKYIRTLSNKHRQLGNVSIWMESWSLWILRHLHGELVLTFD